jgi:glycosyltransferase involved in cell wall biosynthesis
VNVLHVVHSRAFAGTERHILGVSREMREMGHSVLIACPGSADTFRQAASHEDFEVIHEGSVRKPRALDVVHSHDGRSTLAGAFATSGRATRFVRTQHFVHPASMDRRGLTKTISYACHRTLNARLDGYICVSREAARAAQGRGEVSAPVTVIPPGVAVPDALIWEESVAARSKVAHPVVVSAGRLEDERSFETFIRAVALVHPVNPTCRFLIAGDGEAGHGLRALAEELGVAGVIRWLGWITDLQTVLTQAHLYVNTWPAEGFGMATAEAMAAGVPVVVPSSGAAPELVAGGVGGWTVPPRDAPALAAKMLEQLSDRNRLAEQGARARERAASLYSVASAARAICDFYEIVARAPSSPMSAI